MRVLLRCDATPAVGAGRLLRGLAVAEALAGRGHEAVLSAEITDTWVAEVVEDAAVPVLPPAATGTDLLALAAEQQVDLVHLDLLAPAGIEQAFADGGPRLSVLHDGGGATPATAALTVLPTIDGDATGATEATAPDVQHRAVGAEFAPVRAAVLDARQRRQWRAGGMSDRLRVLVLLGAESTATQLLTVVQALVESDVNADVLAVAPSPATGRRAESLSSRSVRVLATGHRADLPRLVADHDLVVTRPGRLLWEVSCIGTPAALVALTAEDDASAAAWVRAEVAVLLGRPGTVTGNKMRAILRDGMRRAGMSSAGLRLVDGGGAGRVVDLMERLVGS